MRLFLFTVLAAFLTAAFVSSFALTWIPVTSSPARLDTEIVVKQLRTVRIVAARPAVAGYRRERFDIWDGSAGCDIRHKVLVTRFGGLACSLNDGPLREILDPYTDDPVGAHEVDTDHIYPLTTAWDFGAYAWDAERRRQFGNDIETNLVPTRNAVDQDRGDTNPAEQFPEDAKVHDYSYRYLTVAIKRDLLVSSADWKAMATACGICAGKGTKQGK